MAELYRAGQVDGEPNFEKAIRLLEPLILKKNPNAMNLRAVMYMQGQGGRDDKEALRLLEEAVKLGRCLVAHVNLVEMRLPLLLTDRYNESDYESAIKLLQPAVEANIPMAMCYRGIIHLKSEHKDEIAAAICCCLKKIYHHL